MSAGTCGYGGEVDEATGRCGACQFVGQGRCPAARNPAPKKKRLDVTVAGANPYDVAKEIASHLVKSNEPPRLFRMGGAVVELLDDGTLLPFDNDEWLTYILQRVNFLQAKGDGQRGADQQVLRIAAKLTLRNLPHLDGVTTSPYLDEHGKIHSADGYNPNTRLYLRADGLALPQVSDKPSDEEVSAARKLLLDDWLVDVAFAGDADKAAAIGELLTITGREMFSLVPLSVHDAPTPGSGKGLLLDVLSIVATGKPADIMELPPSREEQQKTILGILLSGTLMVALDEMHVIEGTSLAATLTAESYSARLLGVSKVVKVRNKLVFFALGNNVEVRGDMKRRVSPLRLVPDTDRPEERQGFRHPELKEWTAEHRGELLAAAFTLWRKWISEGRKPADLVMGSFDRWIRTIGGVLNSAGITGFMSDRRTWLSFSEDDGSEWYSHLKALHIRFGEQWFTVQTAADAVASSNLPRPPVKADPDRELSQQIGYAYRTTRDRWHGEYRLVRSTERSGHGGVYEWRVERRTSGAVFSQKPPPSPPSPPPQVRGHKSGGDGGDDPLEMDSSPPPSPAAKPALTCGGGDGGDGGDDLAAPTTSASPRLRHLVRERSASTDSDDDSWVRDAPDGWPDDSYGSAANPRPTPASMPKHRKGRP